MVNDKFTVVPLQIKVLDKLTAVTAKLEVTVTVWLVVAVLPAASVAVQITVVTPLGNLILVVEISPVDGIAPVALHVIVGIEQLSPTLVGVPKLGIMAEQDVVLTGVVIGDGAVIVGNCVSFTCTVKLQVAELLLASVTV